MTEEIKEILDKLQDSINYPKIDMPTFDGSDSEYIDNDTLLEPSKCQLLLNYVTNLQKENEKLKDELKYTIPQVEHNQIVSKLCREKQDYKSRNEKAIEYIKKDTRWFDSEYAKIYGMLCDCEGAKGDRLEVLVNPTNLLNILEGGDE